MSLDRCAFNRFMAAGLTSLALPAGAVAPLLEGRDYECIQPPQPGDSPGKIEILELFSYGLPALPGFSPPGHGLGGGPTRKACMPATR